MVDLYILDTDCVSLILYNHPQLITNTAKHQVAVTIITVQELFNGWVNRINDPSQVNNLPQLYSKFSTTVKYLQTMEISDFTPEADNCLRKLLQQIVIKPGTRTPPPTPSPQAMRGLRCTS